MSGHSKWHSIKHKKAVVDARRGQHFTKLARAITVAAREGGGHGPLEGRRDVPERILGRDDEGLPVRRVSQFADCRACAGDRYGRVGGLAERCSGRR